MAFISREAKKLLSVFLHDMHALGASAFVLGAKCACRPHYFYRAQRMTQTPERLQRASQESFSSLPPVETRVLQNLSYNKGDKETSAANVADELFHYHPSCKTETRTSVSSSFTLFTNFITKAEEDVLRKELDPHLKRQKYEFDHWDDAIHGFREIERSRWTKQASLILARVRKTAFLDSSRPLPQVHVLDLAESGVIKPHVDSVRFCGNIICGLCLLSDAVMRLRHVEQKDQVVDVLLKRRSLYVMRDDARYKYTHEVLGEEESFFKGVPVVKGRRVSIVSRNKPTEQSPDANTTCS